MRTPATQRLRRLFLRATELGAGGAFLGAVVHHVSTQDFRPLAAFFLPVLVALFGFTSLLYMRGRSMAPGRDQVRTLFAAERAMQAIVWYVAGIALGMAMYGLLQLAPVAFDARRPGWSGLWLLGFLAPYALMQAGLLLFMRAAWLVTPQLLRRVSPFEVVRRVRPDPASDSVVRRALLRPVPPVSMPAMMEEVKHGTGQQHEVGQRGNDMQAVFDDEVGQHGADDNGQEQARRRADPAPDAGGRRTGVGGFHGGRPCSTMVPSL